MGGDALDDRNDLQRMRLALLEMNLRKRRKTEWAERALQWAELGRLKVALKSLLKRIAGREKHGG